MVLEEVEKVLKENIYLVGVVIVDGNNNVIVRGRNRVYLEKDIIVYVELDVICNVGEVMFDVKIKNERFIIYSMLELCLMCIGGILFVKI